MVTPAQLTEENTKFFMLIQFLRFCLLWITNIKLYYIVTILTRFLVQTVNQLDTPKINESFASEVTTGLVFLLHICTFTHNKACLGNKISLTIRSRLLWRNKNLTFYLYQQCSWSSLSNTLNLGKLFYCSFFSVKLVLNEVWIISSMAGKAFELLVTSAKNI